jgi:transmembrane sensor
MEQPEARLARLGTGVRDLLVCEFATAREVRLARAEFLEKVSARNTGRLRRAPGWRTVLVAASLAASATAVGIWTRLPVSFRVGVAGAPGRPGDLVQAAPHALLPVRFSDGTVLELHDQGRMRVLATNPKGARVLVEDGILDARVAPARLRSKHWTFEAGPFSVSVKGTKFKMSYRAADQSFGLATTEGQVVVTGPCLDVPVTVAAGSALELSCLVETAGAQPVAAASAAPAPVPRGEQPSAAAPPPDTSIPWRALLAAGRLQEGLRAAERAGFAGVCHTASAKELLVLADAARLFDHAPRAGLALHVLRQRFPASTEAATAAFTLGRVAFEQKHAYGEASKWFATYLREQPVGPLMGDAAGRLMESLLRAGDEAGARAEADHYLHRFPEGPYASEARGILSL